MRRNVGELRKVLWPVQAEPQHAEPWAGAGFFKCMRNPEVMELIAKHPPTFQLLFIIAYRANWHGRFNRRNLKPGQAHVGDLKEMGMKETPYKTAKHNLEKFGFATFEATSDGTIATLINTRIFDINLPRGDEHNDEQPSSERRATVERPTTNEELKKKRIEEGKKTAGLSRKQFPEAKPSQPNRNAGTLNETNPNDYSRVGKVV